MISRIVERSLCKSNSHFCKSTIILFMMINIFNFFMTFLYIFLSKAIC